MCSKMTYSHLVTLSPLYAALPSDSTPQQWSNSLDAQAVAARAVAARAVAAKAVAARAVAARAVAARAVAG